MWTPFQMDPHHWNGWSSWLGTYIYNRLAEKILIGLVNEKRLGVFLPLEINTQ
jgi:hypothetical protein